MQKRFFFLSFCLLTFWNFSSLKGQEDVQLYGFLPGILVNGELGELKYALSSASEINTISKSLGDRTFPAEAITLDFSGVLSYDSGPNLNLAGGFLYRFVDPFSGNPTNEIRPWQQITLISRVQKFRIRNRLRMEQRWRESSSTGEFAFDVRLRYRLSADFPLSGERLDDKEFYLNFSNEVLVMPTIDRPLFFWDYRIYGGLGYRFSDRDRLEPALEFRTRHLDDLGNRRHFLFFRLQYITKIGQ
jgi:hypothetical protein